MSTKGITTLIVSVLGATTLVLFRSWGIFHWLIFEVIIRNGVFWLAAVAIALIWIVTLVATSTKRERYGESNLEFRTWPHVLGLGLCCLLFAYVLFSGGLVGVALSQGTSLRKLEEMPMTTGVRYLPKEVAQTLGANASQDPAYKLGDYDPYAVGDDLNWMAPRIPTGIGNQIFGHGDGVAFINSNAPVSITQQTMDCAEGQAFGKQIESAMWNANYLSDIPEVYYGFDKGQIYAYAPYINYRFDFPVLVPQWGGVFVVNGNCQVENLSPETAMTDPRLTNKVIYPLDLAKQIADAWAWRSGISNALFNHIDQTEVPQMDGNNQMPFIIPSSNGPLLFVGLEPYGPSYSIYKMMFFDGHTGKLGMYELPQNSGLMSPNKAQDFVKSAHPTFDWSNNLVIEPRPITKLGNDGHVKLFWQVSVTSVKYAGVSFTSLVDSLDKTVYDLASRDEVLRFIAGTFAGRIAVATGNPTIPTTAVAPSITVTGTDNLQQMSDEQLIQLIKNAAVELQRRSIISPTVTTK